MGYTACSFPCVLVHLVVLFMLGLNVPPSAGGWQARLILAASHSNHLGAVTISPAAAAAAARWPVRRGGLLLHQQAARGSRLPRLARPSRRWRSSIDRHRAARPATQLQRPARAVTSAAAPRSQRLPSLFSRKAPLRTFRWQFKLNAAAHHGANGRISDPSHSPPWPQQNTPEAEW